ncbi:hypothetical protein AB0K68_36100 [Streptomyces sp. NPDC050698]
MTPAAEWTLTGERPASAHPPPRTRHLGAPLGHRLVSAPAELYLRAVQADDVDAARELAGAEPRVPELLVDVAERIVVPVTTLPGPEAGEPCAGTFALEALGRVFVTSLRIWARAGPDTAGIARAVIDFAQQFLTEDHEDVADTLRQLEAVGVGKALDAHPAPPVCTRCASLPCPARAARWRCAPLPRSARTTHRAVDRGARHRCRPTASGARHGQQAPLSRTPLTAV